MEKILSIIIPTYNMEKYLRKCLDSLIVSDENMQRLEVLVINDGSKDSSSQIAHEYEAKYPETFRVIDKENGNYGSCINRGLKEATGKYVKVLDADDYFDKEILDSFVYFLSVSEEDVIFSDFAYVDEDDNMLSEYCFNLPVATNFTLEEIPTEMVPHLAHYTVTYKKEIFKRFKYKQTEGISYTDDEWVFKPSMWVENVSFFPYILYHYLRGRDGQTFDPKVIKKSLDQRIMVAMGLISFFEENFSKCHPNNRKFVINKLVGRLKSLYNYHLVRFPSTNNKQRIKEFDIFLKANSPKIFESLNNLVNNYGWHYIRQWRKMNYSNYAPAILLIRLKRILSAMKGGNKVIVDRIPSSIKRVNT